jgi:class 3 adenylate cyclase
MELVHDELRPVTALFADIVGSSGLGERLAPDEVKALVGEVVTRMSRAVEEFGGTVQAYQGDGICAYFGVPTAHGDDPERAARAALRLLELVRAHADDIRAAWGIDQFDVRVGLNTGQTAVGNVGFGNPQAVALGDATNVAARLEGLAEPGTILVGEVTARQLERRFVLEERGTVPVKGRARPVRTWRVVALRTEPHEGARTPLLGREAELGQVRRALDDVASGRGGLLSIVGDEGIGKTRLLAEARRLAGDRVTWLAGSCPSYGTDLLYAPFVEILRAWIGASEGEPEIAVRTKARARLSALLGDRVQALFAPLARLLGVKVEDVDAASTDLTVAYLGWVEALCDAGPLVLALDDLQWSDAGTHELAAHLLELTDRLPLLLVVAQAVQAGSEGWALRTRALSDFSHRTVDVPLGPLADDDALELVSRLLPGLDPHAAAALVARGEGNPLYLEELLRLLVDGSGLDRRRTWTVSVGTASLLPPALENILVARYDRLSAEARALAQVAAVIGRSFQVRVVERVVGNVDALPELLRLEAVREVRRYPELECAFRHGLLQEAALSTLTTARRRELYGLVAAAFEELYASSLDEHLERLAHYYAQSDEAPQAVAYLERAAERAERLGALRNADRLRRRIAALGSAKRANR